MKYNERKENLYKKYKGSKYHAMLNNRGEVYLCGCMPTFKIDDRIIWPSNRKHMSVRVKIWSMWTK